MMEQPPPATPEDELNIAIHTADKLYGALCHRFNPAIAAHAFAVVLGYQAAHQADPSNAVTQMAGAIKETCQKRRAELRAEQQKPKLKAAPDVAKPN
jgi:hypothetical protein